MQREIGIIIRVKDAAKAKEEIKGIVDNQVLGHVKKLQAEFDKLKKSVGKTGTTAKKTAGSFEKMFTKMATGVGVLYTLKRGFDTAFGAFEQGAGFERAAVQFESSIGKVSDMLPVLRAATRGTVEDFKLLSTANRAVMEGLNPKSLTKMYQMATVASRKLGIDAEQSIQTISNAIVRQDESALTTLGTILKTNVGLKVQSAIISKNAGVMSGAAAIAIRQSVIMEELNKRFGGFNSLQEDSVEVIQQFRAAVANLRTAIGPVIGQALAPLLKIMITFANATSDVLRMLNNNVMFKSAVRNLGMIAAVFTGYKLVSGLTLVVTKLALFVGGLKALGVIAAGSVALKLIGLDLGDISKLFDYAVIAGRAFYTLITNFDENTGLSKVLTKDKEALGGFFFFIEKLAQSYLIVKAAITGASEGIAQSFSNIPGKISGLLEALKSIPVIGSAIKATIEFITPAFDFLAAAIKRAGDAISNFYDSLGLSHLERIKNAFKGLFTTFGPVGGLNTTIDFYKGAANMLSGSPQSQAPAPVQPQSIQQAEPAIRPQNVEASSSSADMMALMAAMLKEQKGTRESNEALFRIDEQRQLEERTRPQNSAMIPYRP